MLKYIYLLSLVINHKCYMESTFSPPLFHYLYFLQCCYQIWHNFFSIAAALKLFRPISDGSVNRNNQKPNWTSSTFCYGKPRYLNRKTGGLQNVLKKDRIMSNLAEIPTYYLLFSFNFSKKIFKHNCPIEKQI